MTSYEDTYNSPEDHEERAAYHLRIARHNRRDRARYDYHCQTCTRREESGV